MQKSGKMDDAEKATKQEKIQEGSVDKKTPNTAKQSTSAQSDTTDLGAQARIDAEHGIGRKGLTQADLLGGSFRSEMDAMMISSDHQVTKL